MVSKIPIDYELNRSIWTINGIPADKTFLAGSRSNGNEKYTAELEPQYQIKFSIITRLSFWGCLTSLQRIQSSYLKSRRQVDMISKLKWISIYVNTTKTNKLKGGIAMKYGLKFRHCPFKNEFLKGILSESVTERKCCWLIEFNWKTDFVCGWVLIHEVKQVKTFERFSMAVKFQVVAFSEILEDISRRGTAKGV